MAAAAIQKIQFSLLFSSIMSLEKIAMETVGVSHLYL